MDRELRILILEDNSADAELMQRELRNAEITFTSMLVHSREGFIKGLEEFSPDLILADYKLPSFDGISALDISQEKCPDVPFIFVTGTMGEEWAVETLKRGAWDYVIKDRIYRLASVVKRALQDAKERTERKRAEETSKKLWRAIEQSPVTVLITNPKGNIEYVNPKFTELTGYTTEEAIGQNPRMFQSGKTPIEVYKQMWETIASGKEWRGEFVNKKKNGETFYETATISAVKNYKGIITHFIAVKEDITERKRAEEKLRQAEEKYHSIFSNALEGIFQVLPDGRYITANPAFVNMLGYKSPSEFIATVTGIGHQLYVHPERYNELKKLFDKLNIVQEFEIQMYRKDGSIIWVSLNARTNCNDHGTLLYYEGTAQDITEQKKIRDVVKPSTLLLRILGIFAVVEVLIMGILSFTDIPHGIWENLTDAVFLTIFCAPLVYWLVVKGLTRHLVHEVTVAQTEAQANEYRYQTLIDTAPDIVYTLAAGNGIITLLNPAFETITGWTRNEWIGKTFNSIVHPDDLQFAIETFQQILRGENPPSYELRILIKSGTYLVGEFTSVPKFELGKIVGVLGIARDITERKRAEQEIISQKNRFAQLFDNSPIAIALLDDQYKVIVVNESFSALFGYYLEEVKGRTINDLIVSPEFKKEAEAYLGETRSGNHINKESYRMKKDGTLFYVQVVGVPVVVNDKVVGMYGMYVDLTQRKKTEDELIYAKEKAEEMSRLKSNFLANMSHELRTPLNGIMGYADILTSQLDEPELIEMTQGIYDSGKRLSETLNFILDLSAAETDKIEVIAKDIVVVPLVKNKVESFALEAAKRNLVLETVIKEENIFAHLDEHLFNRILHNLLDNALKFTKKGKIIVEIGKEINTEKPWLYIKIKDTGIGIASDKLDLIWEEFRQVSEGLSRSYEGSGLGLTISKKAVELMQGVISVESELGVGSIFTVKFPALKIAPQKEAVVTEKQTAVIQPEKETAEKTPLPLALCVEDDFANRNIIKFFLKNICTVEMAEDAEAALQLTAEKKYDLVLMDINLGGEMNGMEVVQEILKIPQYVNTPLIAVTAYATERDKADFLKGGCTHYISKPFQQQEIIDLVTSALKNN
ncbi:MAG: PAS domain S-box protein [Ignavibacteriaceae bacterium]|jgi:PAS domain S-box-containing protein|nr:PAS domain S-box protein [Ignavibacteriaceae bacterium]